MNTADTALQFTRIAAGNYSAEGTDGRHTFSVMRLTGSRWVLDVFLGGKPVIREEYRTLGEAEHQAERRNRVNNGEAPDAQVEDVATEAPVADELHYAEGTRVTVTRNDGTRVAATVMSGATLKSCIVPVMVDGAGLERPYHGVVTLLEEEAGEVLDVEVLEEAPVQLELDLDATIYGDKDERAPLITEASAQADVDVILYHASNHAQHAANLTHEGNLDQAREYEAEATKLRDRAKDREKAWARRGAAGVLGIEAEEWAADTARKATRRQLAALLEVLRVDAPELLR